MNATMPLMLSVFLPLIVGVLVLPFLRKMPTAMAGVGLATVLVCLLGFLGLHPGAAWTHGWVGPFTLRFELTPWKAFLLSFVFLFQLMNGIYLIRYLKHVKKPYLFMVFTLVALASACGVILTQNVMILLIGWEMFLVALYAMILTGGAGTEPVAYKALLIGGASDFLMILGLMLYGRLGGTTDLAAGTPMAMGSFAAFMSWFLIFLGAGAKAGMYPFHTWIPEAAELMPAPGFAALPASLEKILGIYFLFVVSRQMFALSHLAQTTMYVFAVATIFVSTVPAFIERNFKRVLALTAIAPVGFMVAGLATSTAAGMAGALMYMLTHASYKSTMFYCAGNLELNAGGATLEAIENRKAYLPLTVFAFFMAFTAAISLPPTGGFMAKEFIFEGLLAQGRYGVFFILWVAALLNVAIFLKLGAVLLSGREKKERSDAGIWLVLPVLVLGAAAFLGGWLFTHSAELLGGLTGEEGTEWIKAIWHFSPVTVASLGVYILGAAVFFALRKAEAPAWTTFEFLRTSPVLGRGYELAAQKKFDLYEVGIKVITWMANLVFRYFERLIDEVADWFIRLGGAFSRRVLSGSHNGIYSNYLAWVIAGFALVSALVLLR